MTLKSLKQEEVITQLIRFTKYKTVIRILVEN